jgi:hypothetical protein
MMMVHAEIPYDTVLKVKLELPYFYIREADLHLFAFLCKIMDWGNHVVDMDYVFYNRINFHNDIIRVSFDTANNLVIARKNLMARSIIVFPAQDLPPENENDRFSHGRRAKHL